MVDEAAIIFSLCFTVVLHINHPACWNYDEEIITQNMRRM